MSDQPAGWYADPRNPTGQRWWDGERWTAQTRSAPPPPPDPPTPPGPPPTAPLTPTAPPPVPTQPAGWYPDPRDPTSQRRWDGTTWTHDVRPAPAPPPAPIPDPPPTGSPALPDDEPSTTRRLVLALVALVVVACGLGWLGWQMLSGGDALQSATAAGNPTPDPSPSLAATPEPTSSTTDGPVVAADDRQAALADALELARESHPSVAVLAGTCNAPQPRMLNGIVLDPGRILVPIVGDATSAAVVLDGRAHQGRLVRLDAATAVLVLDTPVDHPIAPADAGPFADDDVLGFVAVGRTEPVTGTLVVAAAQDATAEVAADLVILGATVVDHTGRIRGMLAATDTGLTVVRLPDLTDLDVGAATLADTCPERTFAVEQRVPVEVLTDAPEADAIAATLADYWTAINRRDVDTAFATFAAAERDGLDPDVFADQIASSVDWLPTMHAIAPHPDIDDALAVEVTFTSLQQPDLAPDGVSRCTRWHLLYAMTFEDETWRIIGTRPVVEDAPFVPCV